MLDDKKLYYGHEAKEELVPSVNAIAIDVQEKAQMIFVGSHGVQDVMFRNSMIAAYNMGIMKLREELIRWITKEPEDEDEEGSGNDNG